MNITSDPNLWVIGALIFLVGLLVGVFLTAGGRRKWKHRYKDEADRHQALQREHDKHLQDTEEQRRNGASATACERRRSRAASGTNVHFA